MSALVPRVGRGGGLSTPTPATARRGLWGGCGDYAFVEGGSLINEALNIPLWFHFERRSGRSVQQRSFIDSSCSLGPWCVELVQRRTQGYAPRTRKYARIHIHTYMCMCMLHTNIHGSSWASERRNVLGNSILETKSTRSTKRIVPSCSRNSPRRAVHILHTCILLAHTHT